MIEKYFTIQYTALRTAGRYVYFSMYALLYAGCVSEAPVTIPSQIGEWSYFTASNSGLADDGISAIYQDEDGAMWFGHDGAGLSLYKKGSFTHYHTGNGLLSNVVYCITQDRDDDILVGTSQGLSFYQDGLWYYFAPLNGIPIRYLLQDNDGNIWAGTTGYGILVYDGNDLIQVFDYDCAACNDVYSIRQDHKGNIWFATYGGLKMFDGESINYYTTADGLATNELYSLQEDSWGNIWIGPFEGDHLTRYHDGAFDALSLSNGASANPIFGWVTSIEQGDPGELWLGTYFFGLIHYDGAVMRRIFDGPPGDAITCLHKGIDGAIWIGTSDNGVAKLVTD